jgi:hypothetical protein
LKLKDKTCREFNNKKKKNNEESLNRKRKKNVLENSKPKAEDKKKRKIDNTPSKNVKCKKILDRCKYKRPSKKRQS